MEEFRYRLREIMSERHVKSRELARACEINPAQIARYLKGEYKPRQDKVDRIAEYLSVSPAWLMGFEVSPVPTEEERNERMKVYIEALENMPVTDKERKIVDAYRNADPKTQGVIDFVLFGDGE